jgi:hypothetical protein
VTTHRPWDVILSDGSPGLAHRVLLARHELLNMLVDDGRVRSLLNHWESHLRLASGSPRLPMVSALLMSPTPLDDWDGAVEALNARLLTGEPTALVRLSCQLIRDVLGLRWPCIAVDLVKYYIITVPAHLEGVEMTSWVGNTPAPEAEFRIRSTPESGQTLEEFVARADAAYSMFRANVMAPHRDRGGSTRDKGLAIRRNASWFYRVRVQSQAASINQIAREVAKSRSTDKVDRKSVKDAIRDFENLMDRTSGAWLDAAAWPDPPSPPGG